MACNDLPPQIESQTKSCYLDHTLIRLYFIFPPAAYTCCFKQPQSKVMEDKPYEVDSIETPPCFNKLEPERQGKLVWISGPPGLGKSTTAQLLSREHGYVYYEADCFFALRNPYIPPNAPEPSLATLEQNKLVGDARVQEREEMAVKVVGQFRKMFAGEQVDYQVIEDDIVIAPVIVIVVVV